MDSAGKTGGGSNAHLNELLTERSRKFYDGTYQWDGPEGFRDEGGVYHRFNDENDPEGQPPTPGPVSPPSDFGDDTIDSPKTVSGIKTPDSIEEPKIVANRSASIRPLLSNAILQNTADNIIMHFKGGSYKPTIPHEDLYAGHPDRERLLGRVEGILVGQWAEQTGLGLKECYRLCGISAADAVLASLAVKDWEEKKAPNMRGGAGQEEGKVGSSNASLSDCPSDLSDWEVNDEVMKKPCVQAQQKSNLKRKDEGLGGKHQQSKKGKKGIARVLVRARSSSIDSGIGGISTRRRSARHLKTGAMAK